MENGRQIGLGVIGLGRGFVLTAPALTAHSRVALRGAFDVRTAAAERFTTAYQAHHYPTLQALLAAPDIEAVYVATPHEFHTEHAIAALAAGKHVLIDKPMATSVEECVAIERASRKFGRVAMVGPSHGFDPPIAQARELIRSGAYGSVRLITAFNFTDFMFRPRRPSELDSASGGGVVFSQAAHQIDIVRRLTERPVSSVRASALNWDASRPSEGAYTAMLSFEGGAVASLTYSGYAHYDSDELLGWVSELGYAKDPSGYGGARRSLAAMSPAQELDAKLARTLSHRSQADSQRPAHHEHFGFIMVCCDHADIKIGPAGVTVYGDDTRDVFPSKPTTPSRYDAIDSFIAAIDGTPTAQDISWDVRTIACCVALLESSRLASDVSPEALIAEVQKGPSQ